MIDFEVCSMVEDTRRCFDRKRAGIDDGVGVVDPLYFHIADLILSALDHEVEVFCIGTESMLFEFVFDHCQCERCTVDRELQLFEEVRHRTDMVFVSMRDHNAFDFVFDRVEVGEVRHQDIHPVHRLIRETHAHIDNNGSGFSLEYRHVAADLTQTAQRCKSHFAFAGDIDLLPRCHSGILYTLVLSDSCFHCIIDGRNVFTFVSIAVIVIATRLVALMRFSIIVIVAVVGFSVAALLVLSVFALSVLVPASLFVGVVSVGIGFTVGVWFSVLALFRSIGVVVGSMGVRASLSLCCSLLLILRACVVLIVVFHLNYPLIHDISDDK